MGVRAYNNNRFMRRAFLRLGAVCLLIAGLFGLWHFAPFGDFSSPAQLAALFDELGMHPFAGLIVVAVFLLGSFLVFPVTALVAATGIALGPTRGLVWASAGALIAAIANYALARALPAESLDFWLGSWIGRMRKRFERNGLMAVMVARNLPFAPFTLINLVAGAAAIPFRDYLVGTVIGMGPTIAALTVLGDRLRSAWIAPSVLNIVLLCVAVAAWFLLALSLQTLSNRWANSRQKAVS